MIETGDEIDTFDASVLAVVVVPADDVVLVGVGLFGDTIINDKHPIGLLDLAHIGFDDLPQIGSLHLVSGQQALDLVMADAATQQRRQTRPGGLSKSADEIITLNVEQFAVFHALSLAYPA
jgi:hypothetical protein